MSGKGGRLERTWYRIWKWGPSVRYAFRPRKPVLFVRLVLALFRARVLRKVRLRYVDMALDYACNMRCEHCFATALKPSSPEGGRRMTVADYQRVARQAMELGAVNFSFQGGEPLLLKDLPDYISAVRPGRNVISVTTNGSLLTPERISELKKFGVDILTVSVDSSIAEEHDRFRKFPGAFEKAMAGIREAVAQGLHVTIGTVVTHGNIHSPGIAGLIDFAEKNRILLCFALASPVGNWAHCQDTLLSVEDMALVRKWEKENLYIRTDFEANLHSSGCGAVKEILYLTPYGDVLPCPFIHISMGNVLDEPLGDIWERALTVPDFAHFAPKCLCAEDREFIEKYIVPTCSVGLGDGREIFNLHRSDGNERK